MRTQPGRRDEVVAILLSGADGLRAAGCQLYAVGVSEADDRTIWVSEIWATREQHDASLQLPETRAAIGQAMPAIQQAAERYYLRVCPALHDRHCPAAAETLERLRRRRFLLALVTGNLTRIGWRKLERAGLRKYFRFGAFGEMARNRSLLAKMALRQAIREEWIGRGAPVSLVGDAPADIRAARYNGIRAIAVATGLTPVEELQTEGPDILLEDLRAFRMKMVESTGSHPAPSRRPLTGRGRRAQCGKLVR